MPSEEATRRIGPLPEGERYCCVRRLSAWRLGESTGAGVAYIITYRSIECGAEVARLCAR
eukprot:5383232-Pleurochrysis_carterae.AAC.1